MNMPDNISVSWCVATAKLWLKSADLEGHKSTCSVKVVRVTFFTT